MAPLSRTPSCAASCRGFTLIELMLVVAILPLFALSVYGIMEISDVMFRSSDASGRLNHDAMQSLRSISREIGQTSPNANPQRLTLAQDAFNNTVVTFQTPVDWDNDGDIINLAANPAVEWGAYDQAVQTRSCQSVAVAPNCNAPNLPQDMGRWVRYSVTNNQLNRDVLNAAFAPVPGLSRVVANDVQIFTVNRNQNLVTMTLTLQATDATGQAGTARTFPLTFSSDTVLRNAVG